MEFRATDAVGNVSEVGTASFTIEEQPETPTVVLDPAEADGEDGWYVSPVTVTVEPADPDDDLEVDLGDGWVSYGGPIMLDSDGTHTVSYRAGNVAGTSEVGRVTVPIDAILVARRGVRHLRRFRRGQPGSRSWSPPRSRWRSMGRGRCVDHGSRGRPVR